MTRHDVVSILGEIGDNVVAEIIGTGATSDELIEAKAWLSNNEPLINKGKALPKDRVGDLVELLDTLEDEEPEPPLTLS